MPQLRARLNTLRLKDWDYKGKGLYFVTMLAAKRCPYFGEIVNEQMHMSPAGIIAREEWYKTPGLRPNMKLHLFEFIVMPDHIHALIGISANSMNSDPGYQKSANRFGPQSNNLASVIRGYKSAVTAQVRKQGIPFAWHRGYHDMIIRDTQHLINVARYIEENPQRYR